MKAFATLSGLGDAFFAFPVVAHFAASGPVCVATEYPEVFAGAENVTTTRERPPGAVSLRYSRAPGRNYYADICEAAGLGVLPYRAPHIGRFSFDAFGFDGRPVCLVKEPSAAHMDRKRRDYRMAPPPDLVQNWIFANRGRFNFIAVQHDTNEIDKPLVGIDARIHSVNAETYLRVCASVDYIATQVGHLLPIAQAFKKPFTVFKPRGPLDGFVKNLTLAQVLIPGEPGPAEVLP